MRTSRILEGSLSRPRRLLGAIALLVGLTLLPTAAEAIQLPTLTLRQGDCVTVSELCWHTDYTAACEDAKSQKKMLLVNFVPNGSSTAQRGLEKYLHENEAVRKQLKDYVLVRVFENDRNGIGLGLLRKNRVRLLDEPAFRHLGHSAGLAIVDLKHSDDPYYKKVVTVLPYRSGKYYRWTNSHLPVALGLPAGTITQRMMVWAVRIHPEHPQSTGGMMHPALAAAAAKQSAYQASIGVQGHQNWGSRFHLVVSQSGAGTASEVVAESWPGQDLIDSCIDCTQSWRHSSGHWGAVKRSQRMYGYDICQGANGIWYGTGIFAN